MSVLESEYRALHPGLLRYLSADDLNEAFAQLRLEFSHPRSVGIARRSRIMHRCLMAQFRTMHEALFRLQTSGGSWSRSK
jgi:hypothetical protein